MKFDMDMHVKKEKIKNNPILIVYMNKKNDPKFIVMKRVDYFIGNFFHGIGYWTKETEVFEDPEINEEVWIPYCNINYVKSLLYTKK